MNESQQLAQKIQQDIDSKWPILAEQTVEEIDDRLKWSMNCAGFKPHSFRQLRNVNKNLKVGNNEYFFLTVGAHSFVMVDYWSNGFQFHGWQGPSKHPDELTPDELKAYELCKKYQYAD